MIPTTKQKIIRPLLAVLIAQMGLAPLSAYAQVSDFDVQRATTQRAAVRMAAYQIATKAGNLDADTYQETPAMLMGAGGPVDGGLIPDGEGFPRTDGYGAILGYCAWDNGPSTNLAGHIPGGLDLKLPVFAVISYGLNNTFDTTCADIVAGGNAKGDDYVYWFSVSNTSYTSNTNILNSRFWRDPVATQAALQALDPNALVSGEIRMVQADNSIWTWNGTAWNAASIGGVASDGSGNAIIQNKLAVGQATAGAEQLFVNGGAGSAGLGVQSSGSKTGTNIYNGGGTQTAFIGYDNTNNYTVVQSLSGPIVLQSGGARLQVNTDGSLSQNNTVVLDATRNLLNVVNGTFSGAITANTLNATNSIQLGGATVIDATRNATFSNLTAAGNATVSGTLGVTGAATLSGGLTTTSITATGAFTGTTGSFSGALTSGSLSTGAITASGLLSANNGVNTTTLTASGQVLLTQNSTAAAPGFAFTSVGNTGTGMYSSAANMLGFATAGTSRLTIAADGTVAIANNLTVGGTTTLTGALSGTSATFSGSLNAGTINATSGGYQVGGVTVIDGSRNATFSALTATTGTFSGLLTANGGINTTTLTTSGNATIGGTLSANLVNSATGYQVGGVTVIDSSRNGSFAALTASGLITANNGVTVANGKTLTLGAGTATSAPVIFAAGPVLSTPTGGAMEYDGNKYYLTASDGVRKQIATSAAPAAGQLLIGNSAGTWDPLYLSGNNVTISSGPDGVDPTKGKITISIPQSVATSASPTFSALTTTNGLTVGSTLGVAGNASIGGTLGVTGTSTLGGAVTINNTLTVSGATTINNTLTMGKEIVLAQTDSYGTTVAANADCSHIAKGSIAADSTGNVYVCR